MKQKSDEHPSSTKERQSEFFSEFETPSMKKPGYFLRQDMLLGKKIRLDLSYENLILFFIVFIMLLVISFSLGTEKGKRITLQNDKAKIINKHAYKMSKKAVMDKEEIGENREITETSKLVEKKISETSTKPYAIQVIAFKDEKNTKKEVDHLKSKGYEVLVIPSKEWFQVCVGRYGSREESKRDLDILKRRYPTCYVRQIEKSSE